MGACSYCMCVYVWDSLIPQVARIGEGLQLDGRLRDSLSSLGLDDGPIDALLQVDEAPVVAHGHTARDVVVLHEIGVPDSVGTHDVVHVHADGVADFGRQGGHGGGPGLTLPGRGVVVVVVVAVIVVAVAVIFGELEDDTLKTDCKCFTTCSIQNSETRLTFLVPRPR